MAEKKITVRKIIQLSERVLEGSLTLEEINSYWSPLPKTNKFAEIFEILEDGIEHTPGYWFKSGISKSEWARTPMYKNIEQKIDFLRSRDPNKLIT